MKFVCNICLKFRKKNRKKCHSTQITKNKKEPHEKK